MQSSGGAPLNHPIFPFKLHEAFRPVIMRQGKANPSWQLGVYVPANLFSTGASSTGTAAATKAKMEERMTEA